jgi:peptidoglycan/xylan/chitin deacetylase (PgdA/CDA1 family)
MRTDEARASRRQLLVGLLLIPASLLPFLAYAALTPEGQLLRDKAELALAPPELGSVDAMRRQVGGAIPMYRDAVMPLVYHGVGSSSSAEGDYAVSPERLGEHLAALRAAGAHFVTPERVAEAFAGGRALPSRAVLLTFDDGRTDAMMWATPLLEQADAVATMFVITGAAEDKAVYYADWGALERYDRGPWNLQSHTDALHVEQDVTRGGPLPALTSLAPGETLGEYRSRVRADLGRASTELRAHTGRRPVAFAYPFGAHGTERTNDARIDKVLREEVARRYALAFHQDDQETVPLATAESDPLGLRRLSVGDWSPTTLVRRIAAAVERTELPGEELELVPPSLADEAPVPVPAPSPQAPAPAPGRRRAPAPLGDGGGQLASASASASASSAGSTTRRSFSVSTPSPEPSRTTEPEPERSSPPTTSAPSSAPASDPPGNGNGRGRERAPGQQKK